MVVNESESCFFGRKRKPTGYKVAPFSRTKLRSVANQLRQMPHISECYRNDGTYLDAGYLLESVLFRAGYILHPVEDKHLTETAAFTVPEENVVVLRSSVYDGLCDGDPFSRYTVVHEFSHIVLKHAVTLHRGAVLGEHEWYEDSEWQANNLTAELMMPVDVVRRIGGSAIRIAAECGVSLPAAQYRIENLVKDRLI